MPACVALLRGINVGGHNKLPMAELRQLLQSLGCRNVSTYIQSGNAVFETNSLEGLADRIVSAIDKHFGFSPCVTLIADDEFTRIAKANPYANREVDAKCIHVAFLLRPPADVDYESLRAFRGEREEYELSDAAFYLFAPDGIARSKLAAGLEKCLQVPATSRNWRTVCKLREMLDALSPAS